MRPKPSTRFVGRVGLSGLQELDEGMASGSKFSIPVRCVGGWIGAAVLALGMVASAPAEAAGRHAAMVIDGNTGQVLHAQAADEARYPASLTKMMTLYIAFELMEQGRMSPTTMIRISDEAAGTPPSKLGLPAGSSIALQDAIKAIITKSANDLAVALAEHIAGSETKFAILMTRKARQLGMSTTTFKNAHGLPDSGQMTSARDMLTLALRLNDDFPKYYQLFSLRSFSYNGHTYRNHNTMLDSYAGMDGLKTGYTSPSGFNLVASVRRNGRHVVAAVFGGSSAAARNAHMRTILDRALVKASTAKTRVAVPVARLERLERKERPAARQTAEAPAPVLVEPIRPAARPLAAPQAPPAAARTADAEALTRAIGPSRPVQVAPRQRIAAAAQPSAPLTQTAPTAAPVAQAAVPATTAEHSAAPVLAQRPTTQTETADQPPAKDPAEDSDRQPAIDIAKVRPVMVAPRARIALAEAMPAATSSPRPAISETPGSVSRDVPRSPPALDKPYAAAFDDPDAEPKNQPARVAAVAPPGLARTAPAPIAPVAANPPPKPAFLPTAAPIARPIAPVPAATIARPSVAAPTNIATAAPVAPAARGMAPSSLQAQAERLKRGNEPIPSPPMDIPRTQALASAGTAGPTFRLRGPETAPAATVAVGGVAIQIGAYATEAEAMRQLEAIRAKSGAALKQASPTTQSVQANGRQLYRARFVGLDAQAAATACIELRRNQIDCHVAAR